MRPIRSVPVIKNFMGELQQMPNHDYDVHGNDPPSEMTSR
jgi:hypothetical protein